MATQAKPRQTRPSDIKPEWRLIDAEGKTLGRLASEIAVLLMGKHRPIYVPNLNTGDFVIVTNANKIRVTGKKLKQKRYFNHSGYHGGIRERTLADLLEKWPTEAVRHAVKGMLPKNTPGRRMLSRLKLYAGPDHPHKAQLNAGARSARAAAATQREAEKTASVETEEA
jgi:large subunit ribosomal protein L13